jgi:hypothetical protein
LEKCYQAHKDKAEFILVYIREAHPEDGWQVPMNRQEGIIINQHKNEEERGHAASTCAIKLSLTLPFVIDTIDNKVDTAYTAWPDRLYIVDRDGKIAFKGQPGPRGFVVVEMETKLDQLLKVEGKP